MKTSKPKAAAKPAAKKAEKPVSAARKPRNADKKADVAGEASASSQAKQGKNILDTGSSIENFAAQATKLEEERIAERDKNAPDANAPDAVLPETHDTNRSHLTKNVTPQEKYSRGAEARRKKPDLQTDKKAIQHAVDAAAADLAPAVQHYPALANALRQFTQAGTNLVSAICNHEQAEARAKESEK